MELTPELIGNAIVGIIVIAAIVGNYVRSLRQPPARMDPLMSAVAGGFIERDLMEKLVQQVTRIADALTDKNAEGIKDGLAEMRDAIEELKRRPARPRRRT